MLAEHCPVQGFTYPALEPCLVLINVSVCEPNVWTRKPAKEKKEGYPSPTLTIRDVTNFKFEFDNVRTSYIFGRFKIRRIVKIRFCRMRIIGKVTFVTYIGSLYM